MASRQLILGFPVQKKIFRALSKIFAVPMAFYLNHLQLMNLKAIVALQELSNKTGLMIQFTIFTPIIHVLTAGAVYNAN